MSIDSSSNNEMSVDSSNNNEMSSKSLSDNEMELWNWNSIDNASVQCNSKYEPLIRSQIEPNEYLKDDAMNAFIEIVNKNSHFKIQSTLCIDARVEANKYKVVNKKEDDIQIFFCNFGSDIGHWICTFYNYQQNKVHIYDSLFTQQNVKSPYWNSMHMEAIKRLYPKIDTKKDLIFKQLITTQKNNKACGIYTCANVISLVFGQDPSLMRYRKNTEANGDEAKFLRFRLTAIFRTEKISLFISN